MFRERSFQVASGIFAAFLAAVWLLVYRYSGKHDPFIASLLCSLVGLIFFALYLVYMMMKRTIAAQTASPTAAKTSTAGPPSGHADPEVSTFKEMIANANLKLADSLKIADKRGRTTIDQLPLFLIVGLEGTGKTSVFQHSGLEPVLLAGHVFNANRIVPTAQCNIWLAGESIFAEVGGRFLSGDTERFRRVLKLLLPGGLSIFSRLWGRTGSENLRGVILCCDTGGFVGVPNPAQMEGITRLVQERLRAVGEVFRVDFPVYTVFTKSDQVKYFGEFFARLDRKEQKQVLGCTLSLQGRQADSISEEAEHKRIATAINKLYYSLAENRLVLLPREPDGNIRHRAYEYPRELNKRVSNNIVHFLVNAFRPNPLQPGPLLRGFYFAGTRMVADEEDTAPLGTDDATIVQTARSVSARTTRAPGALVERWAFAEELFAKTILQDKSLRPRRYTDQSVDRIRRVAFAAGILVFWVMGALTVHSWWKTRGILGEIAETVGRLPSSGTTSEVLQRLPDLERQRQQLLVLRQYQERGPDWFTMRLYTGDRASDPARSFYFSRFQRYLLAEVEEKLRGQLNKPGNSSYSEVYTQLKAYRSITSQACPVDPIYLSGVWNGNRGLREDSADAALVKRQFVFFAEERKSGAVPIRLAENEGAVARARSHLAQFDLMSRIYQSLLDEVEKVMKPARLEVYSPKYREALRADGEVHAAFTKEAATLMLGKIEKQDWPTDKCIDQQNGTVAQTSDPVRLQTDLRNKYLGEYITKWHKFLAASAVIPYNGPKDAAAKLKTLQDKESPVVAALFMTRENTDFGSAQNTIPSNDVKNAQPGRAGQPVLSLSVRDITKSFQPTHTLFTNEAARDHYVSKQVEPYLESLWSLMQAMDQAEGAKLNSQASAQARQAYEAGMTHVRRLAGGFHRTEPDVDRVAQHLLEAPLENAKRFFEENPRQEIETAVAGLCRSPILRKRPFYPKASEVAERAELIGFFAPQGGALWKVFREHLATALEEGHGEWVQKTDSKVTITAGFRKGFNRMASVSRALFQPNGSAPDMEYQIRLSTQNKVNDLTLDDGTEHRQGNLSLRWPREKFKIGVSPGSPMANYAGMWSLFDMASNPTTKHPAPRVIELDCVFAPGSNNRCDPQTAMDGKQVIVRIEVLKPPNGVESALDRDFLNLTGACVAPATAR